MVIMMFVVGLCGYSHIKSQIVWYFTGVEDLFNATSTQY